ncbi:MAG: hypothetical protein KKB50_05915 [Planctomycetes bacterium]|nr:hypothetical protein [Planctomycetota bacterium]
MSKDLPQANPHKTPPTWHRPVARLTQADQGVVSDEYRKLSEELRTGLKQQIRVDSATLLKQKATTNGDAKTPYPSA